MEAIDGTPIAADLLAEYAGLAVDLDVGVEEMARFYCTRGIWHHRGGRRSEGIADLREAARLGQECGTTHEWALALFNLACILILEDPLGAADAARVSADLFRRMANRECLSWAISMRASALRSLGHWDAARVVLRDGVDSDGLDDQEWIDYELALLAALQGDVVTARRIIDGPGKLRDSPHPQDQTAIASVDAFIAYAEGDLERALTLVMPVFDHTAALGINEETSLWAWPLAVRVAHEIADFGTVHQLLDHLENYRNNQLAPLLDAESALSRARLAVAAGEPDAVAAMSEAVAMLRTSSTPYHLASGLLDLHDALEPGDVADSAAEEARSIALGLHCQPLLQRCGHTVTLPSETALRVSG
jgi:hypothetical protein